MKTWRWIVVFLASGALATACTTSSSDTDDEGTGGSATSSGTGAAGGSTVTSTTTTSTTTTSTTTGPMGCDTGLGSGFQSPECTACIQCTQTADCQTEWSMCMAGSACGDFITCLDDCDTANPNDEAAFDTCVGTDVADVNDGCSSTAGCIAVGGGTGCNDYLSALSCSVCQFCPGDCDAATNCS
jgi:hypothetical protein